MINKEESPSDQYWNTYVSTTIGGGGFMYKIEYEWYASYLVESISQKGTQHTYRLDKPTIFSPIYSDYASGPANIYCLVT